MLLNPCQRFSIPSALLSLDWCYDISFSAPYCLFCPHSSSRMGAPQTPSQPRLGAPLFCSRLFTSLPLSALLSMDGLLCCIGAPQSPSAILGLDLPPSISFCITISTPLDHLTRHQALLLSWWRTSFSPEFIILPFNLHFDSPQANLNSNPFGYHKLSQTTLEFNFTHSPDLNHSEI